MKIKRSKSRNKNLVESKKRPCVDLKAEVAFLKKHKDLLWHLMIVILIVLISNSCNVRQ